jgi:surface carbohydrate biosynthesis protein
VDGPARLGAARLVASAWRSARAGRVVDTLFSAVTEMRNRTNLLFPVEIINRELDFRLYLAGVCAEPTNRIFVGQHDVLYEHMLDMRGGVYAGKNIFQTLFPTNLERYANLKERDFAFVHLDEEGLVDAGEDESVWQAGLRLRLDPNCLDAEDWVCTWGDYQRDFYRSTAPSRADRIQTTGHPRFELCKRPGHSYFADEVADLRRRYGRFILVNTSFGYANHAGGPSEHFSPATGYRPDDLAIRDRYFREWLHETHLVSHFTALIHRLSIDLPDANVVVRPHPSEDRSLYEAVFRDIANVHVVREWPVIPWLLACAVMIHGRSSTGIEAALAETPIINYVPIDDNRHHMYLPSLFGVKCTTESEVLEAVRQALATETPQSPQAEVTPLGHALMANFSQDAVESFAAVLADAERGRESRATPDETTLRRAAARRKAVDRGKRVVRPLFREKQRAYELHHRLFPGFDRRAVDHKVATVERMTRKRLRHRLFGDSLLVIERID